MPFDFTQGTPSASRGVRLKSVVAALLLVALLLPLAAAAQIFRRGRQQGVTVPYDSNFVFTRIRYGASLGRFYGGGWEHDYPTAERNFAAILDYITNMRVRMDGSNILDLDDSRIFENPVIYMSEPGYWSTNEVEAKNLREYLLKGGLIIFDDFEGDGHWRNMVAQMKVALPNHHFIRLDVTHPVFQSFFNIKHLDVPHPTVNVPPSFWGMFDNNDPAGRMIALANWNNDLGDYWEWSAEGLYGTDPTNDAYRLGVNYIVYAMTH
jgi:uncharacterized protein DUF4159